MNQPIRFSFLDFSGFSDFLYYRFQGTRRIPCLVTTSNTTQTTSIDTLIIRIMTQIRIIRNERLLCRYTLLCFHCLDPKNHGPIVLLGVLFQQGCRKKLSFFRFQKELAQFGFFHPCLTSSCTNIQATCARMPRHGTTIPGPLYMGTFTVQQWL